MAWAFFLSKGLPMQQVYRTIAAWSTAGCPSASLVQKATLIPAALSAGDSGGWIEITNEAADRYGDVVKVSGWELADYRANPVVLFGHDYSRPPIGRCKDLRVEASRILGLPEFPDRETYAFGACCGELMRKGFLNAASVGFIPLEYELDEQRMGFTFSRQTLLEFSLCSIPANPLCLIDARTIGIDLAPMAAWADQALQENSFETLCYTRPQLERLTKALGAQRSFSIPRLGAGWPTTLKTTASTSGFILGAMPSASALRELLTPMQQLSRTGTLALAYGTEASASLLTVQEQSQALATQHQELMGFVARALAGQRDLASLLADVVTLLRESPAVRTADDAEDMALLLAGLDDMATHAETVQQALEPAQRLGRQLHRGLVALTEEQDTLATVHTGWLSQSETLTQGMQSLSQRQQTLIQQTREVETAAEVPVPEAAATVTPDDDPPFLTLDDEEEHFSEISIDEETATALVGAVISAQVQAGIRAALGRVD
jgi:HK97 family phage prohead protease